MSELDLATYYSLKKQHELLSQQLDRLNKKIKEKATIHYQEPYKIGQELVLKRGPYIARVKVKQARKNIDKGALAQLLVDKNLWSECTRVQVDEDLVEQAFIEGKLTDSDLRSISAGSNIQFSLSVERVEE